MTHSRRPSRFIQVDKFLQRGTETSNGCHSQLLESFQIVNYMNVAWTDMCSHCAPIRYVDADVKTDQSSCAWLYILRVGEWRMDMWKLFTSCLGFVTLTLSQHIRMWETPSQCFTPHWTTTFLWAHQTKNTTRLFTALFKIKLQSALQKLQEMKYELYFNSAISQQSNIRTLYMSPVHALVSPCANNKWGKK